MVTQNFFVAGIPVWGEQFFGRKKALQRILLSSQNVIFIGLRRIGKSSLLLQARKELETENDLAIYFVGDDYSIRNADDFIHEFSAALAQEIERKPKTVQEKVAKPKKDLKVFRKSNKVALWEFENTLAQINQSGLRIILLVDEIDSLLRLADEDAARTAGIIRSLTSRGNFRTVCTTFLEPTAVKIANPGSAWYNIFTIEYLGLFTDDEAIEMLTTLSHKSGNSLSEKECRFLMEVFGNFPFFLQAAGSSLMYDEDFRSTNSGIRRQAFAKVIPQVVHSLNNFHIQYLMDHLDVEALFLLKKVSQGKKLSSAQEERLFWKLSQLGLIVGTIEKPSISSLMLLESMNLIQEKSLLDWEKVRAFSIKTLETATTEAIKIAVSKYL